MSAPAAPRCERCGGRLSAGGECPSCLLSLGMNLEGAEPEEETRAAERPAAGAPHRIGPFTIREVLGQGGMGIVYLAEQTHPFRRRVALKLIKPGMDSAQVIARFESERQALALMNHPNVARVFDAGVSEDGRPYFVMEYVPGVPITEYCDRRRLSLRERLDLFVQACEALQHAHQKGIIHRDVKPSNVLVSVENDRAAVKVIDFGVAKATSQKLTERTLHTRQGIVIGTPEYMSPEQAWTTALDVDTRADIYSLGVVLYELLVGVLPFDSEQLRRSADLEMLRIIRELEPPRPATRVLSLGDTAREVARCRRLDPPSLVRMVSGELEWITLKALEKDPGRRYSSASEFAADLRRYLGHEPVLARPQTAWYWTRKFVRRHRLPVAAAGAIAVALAAGMIVSTLLYFRAAEARDAARVAADEANAINAFLQDTLGAAEPGKLGRDVRVVDVLDRAAAKVDTAFGAQPEVRLGLHGTLGGLYTQLGVLDRAEQQILEILEQRRRTLGADARPTIQTTIWLGRVHFEGRRYEDAIENFFDAFQRARRVFGLEDQDTSEAMHLLGNVYSLVGRQKEAEPLLVDALRIHDRVFGPGHFKTGTNHLSLATLYLYSQRLDPAEEHFRRANEIFMRTVGEVHWLTQRSLEELALIRIREGKLDEAEPMLRRGLEICRKELGEYHTQTAVTSSVMAELEVERENFDEAERIMRSLVRRHRENDMGDRILTADLRKLAWVLARAGKDDAIEAGREAVAQGIKDFGQPHIQTAGALRSYAVALYRAPHAHDFAESEAVFRRTIAMYKELFGDLHPWLAGTLQDMGRMEHARGRHQEAANLFAEALHTFDALGLDAPWTTSELRSELGGCLVDAGRYAEAETQLAQAYEFLRSKRGDADRLTVDAARRRIALFEATRRTAEAAELRRRLPAGG